MWMLLSKPWARYALTALLAAGIGAVAALELRPLPLPVVTEKVVEGKRETVVVERVVEKIVKPDGTVTERTTEKAKTSKVDTRKSERNVVLAPAKPQYSLGLKYAPAVSEAPSFCHVEIEVSRRIGQTNGWVTGGYSLKHNQVTLGLRYEF